MINKNDGILYKVGRFFIVFKILFICLLWSSGGYDHGTSTGKGKLQMDLTWNPFNYFKYGQSYVVFGYGITNKIDLHGYYADHGNYKNGVDSYYYGIYYQFLDSQYLDLATAFGKRKMMDLEYGHFFFPQLLYNMKLYKDYSLGGSIVRIQKDTEQLLKNSDADWFAIDIALFIPLTRYFSKYKNIEEVKLGVGTFRTDLGNDLKKTPFMPTYSIDIKFKPLQRPK